MQTIRSKVKCIIGLNFTMFLKCGTFSRFNDLLSFEETIWINFLGSDLERVLVVSTPDFCGFLQKSAVVRAFESIESLNYASKSHKCELISARSTKTT